MTVPTVPTRIALRTAVLALFASAVLLAAPIAAETYLITLQNGGTIQSRYQPQESSWDAGMVLFMTETGNWIGLKKSDIVSVEQENNLRGFGFVINPTTVALGWAPNDAADPAAPVEGDFGARLLQALSPPPAPAKENYTVQQGVSTEQTQGIPLSYIGQGYGGTQQQAPQAPSVVILPQATPAPATPANSDLTPPP
ncbi:MAG TPA: hypothetical protein VGS22_01230 [Thermoanaerobaculia bacterium]|jgi:hypothetical protein|nr:hypothetical protein [Thermoanaerobaculia bacterium]